MARRPPLLALLALGLAAPWGCGAESGGAGRQPDPPLPTEACCDGYCSVTDEVSLQRLRSCVCINGDLEIIGADLRHLDLPDLVAVSGYLMIRNNPSLASLDLPSLDTVGGVLWLSDNAALRNLGLNALAGVGGSLYLHGNTDLTSLEMGNLASVDGGLTISRNDGLKNLEAGRLAAVEGDLSIHNNAALASLDGLRSLSVVGGDLHVHDNPTLPGCEAHGLLHRLAGFAGRSCFRDNRPGACPDTCG
jgi:hypothetical protein